VTAETISNPTLLPRTGRIRTWVTERGSAEPRRPAERQRVMAKRLVSVVFVLLAASAVAACASTAPAGPVARSITRAATSSPLSPSAPATAEDMPPTPTSTPNFGPAPTGAGIRGMTVVDGCPVKVNPPCPDKPVAARLSLVDAATGSVVATADSGTDGLFSIGVRPGQYVLRQVSAAGVVRPAGPITVTVAPDRYTTVTVRFASGIR
jgi:hypothetical protein